MAILNPTIYLRRSLETKVAAKGDRFVMGRYGGKDWLWRVLAKNNRQIGGSTEGYRSRSDCLKNAARLLTGYCGG